jgi:spectinomycin phosphotransferase
MLEPPNLPNEAIITSLQASYGIPVATLTFLPIGADSAAWVYRVQALDGATYFLKVRTRVDNVLSLVIPRYLHERGVPHLVAPLPAGDQALWVTVDDFALILYPFVEGGAGVDVGLSEQHWVALGAMMKQIHATQLPPDLAGIVRRETYVPWRRELIPDLEAAVAAPPPADPVARELAAFWHSRWDTIRTLVDRADALGRQLEKSPAPLALCHADLHTWNVMIDITQQLWLVDWDEVVLAPIERDLMFVIGGIGPGLVSPHDTEAFFRGYGATTIDARRLAYYRCAWAVQDIAAYAEQVFLSPDLGEVTRRDAARVFMLQFEPDNMVELALASES